MASQWDEKVGTTKTKEIKAYGTKSNIYVELAGQHRKNIIFGCITSLSELDKLRETDNVDAWVNTQVEQFRLLMTNLIK